MLCANRTQLQLHALHRRVPVPRRIRFGRPLDTQTDNDEYLLTLGMMLGLRVAVGRQENPLERPELSVQDFYQVRKQVNTAQHSANINSCA
jgi:hypothetical protein